MGVVYEAHDTARDMIVALKTLRTQDANLLYHFKNEFRSLADLSHRNLCTLYELLEADGRWFFTMELVSGCDITTWIRGGVGSARREIGDGGTLLEFVAPEVVTRPIESASTYDESRLRDALVQLARGLDALHAAGKVHRDIKPSNILVSPEGRVVIMDFGLVADGARLAEFASARMIAGTPSYMAPEQGIPGAEVGTAADWYAIGVLLYELLTGRLPYTGATLQELIDAKRTPPPRVAEAAPADLAELCERLLAPDPARRPDGAEVLARLGTAGAITAAPPSDVFVGRRAELGALHAALAASRHAAVAVVVEGPSGLGKTALVRRFLDEIQGTATMILDGRCYAEETVPYKAFDGIVDALTRQLLTMDPARARQLVPPEAALAARLFPVLRRVPWFRDASEEPACSALELRTRAFAQLALVLARIATSQPLLVFVDDLQWADADSLLLLRELLHPTAAPRVAFVASVRSGNEAGATAIAELDRFAADLRRIALAPLPADDAAQLVDHLLPASSPAHRDDIAREAGGHPLFLAELAHHVAGASIERGAPMARLDEALWQRANRLEPDARRLLHVIAVAGTPLDTRIAADASELSATRSALLLAALRGGRFVKAHGATVEPYHDRVREAVTARIDPAAFTALSSHLAHAMLRAGIAETAPEQVVRHLLAAGDRARGRELAERAAARARAGLAFDRAAEFLRIALAAGARDADHARTLHLALADALASAGRGAEAADAYLAAARDADADAWLDCRRHAADQLLASGHVDRGLAALGEVLARLGEQVAGSPDEALASLERVRARIDAAPLLTGERREISIEVLRRIDVYQSTAQGLLLVDNVRGADFQARALELAIAAGERRRLLRALVFEAIYRAQEGEAGRVQADALQEAAATIAATGAPDAWMDAHLVLARAFLEYYRGRFRRAVELFEDAGVKFRVLPDVAWEQNTIKIHRLRATDYQGAWGELRALYDEYLRDAQRRDDRYVEASIRRWFNVLWLAHDRPDYAGADLDGSPWTPPAAGRYHLQHFLELRARVELALYRGEGGAQRAWARPALEAAERSYLLRIQIARAIADWLLGRIAACEGDVAEVEHRARLLADHRIGYATIWSGLLAAAALAQRGRREAAIARLEDTAAFAEAGDFPLCAAIARLRAGQLDDSAAGRARAAAATVWMTNQEIQNPLAMSEVFAPGFG
jgi:eukaryotic-like serine/threonine-protein kinase